MTAIPAVVRTTLDDARRAAEAEGIFQPTKGEMDQIKRIADLVERIKRDEAERDALIASLKDSMAARDAEKLAHNGANVAQWVKKTAKVLDEDALSAAMPSVVALYRDAKTAYDTAAAGFIRTEVNPHGSFRVRMP